MLTYRILPTAYALLAVYQHVRFLMWRRTSVYTCRSTGSTNYPLALVSSCTSITQATGKQLEIKPDTIVFGEYFHIRYHD